jgi:hypothetical protein
MNTGQSAWGLQLLPNIADTGLRAHNSAPLYSPKFRSIHFPDIAETHPLHVLLTIVHHFILLPFPVQELPTMNTGQSAWGLQLLPNIADTGHTMQNAAQWFL